MAGGMHDGDMHGRGVGVCMTGGAMYGGGHAWQGACMAEGMYGKGCAWQGMCMAERHAWLVGVHAAGSTHPT